jgi:hypothetical protein
MDRQPGIVMAEEKEEAMRHTLWKNLQLVVYKHFLKYKLLLNTIKMKIRFSLTS